MHVSREQFFNELAAGHSGPVIPEAKRAYFRARLRNRLFNHILEKFVAEQKNGLTKAALGRRIGKPPEMINRWLGTPSNLTLDTVSDLLLGICGEELVPRSESVLNKAPGLDTGRLDQGGRKSDERSKKPDNLATLKHKA